MSHCLFVNQWTDSEANRQLLRHLSFNLRNLGLFGIELSRSKLHSGAGLSYVWCNLELNLEIGSSRFETRDDKSLPIRQPTANQFGSAIPGVGHSGVLLYTVIHPSSPDPNHNPTLMLYPRNDGPPEWWTVNRRPSRFAGRQYTPKSPAFATLINHAYTCLLYTSDAADE